MLLQTCQSVAVIWSNHWLAGILQHHTRAHRKQLLPVHKTIRHARHLWLQPALTISCLLKQFPSIWGANVVGCSRTYEQYGVDLHARHELRIAGPKRNTAKSQTKAGKLWRSHLPSDLKLASKRIVASAKACQERHRNASGWPCCQVLAVAPVLF